MPLLNHATSVAARLLQESLPRRWAHSEGVARQCGFAADALDLNVELLMAAGWLHDIGYAPELRMTGLHSLDGARFLREVQLGNSTLWALVAHHSRAVVEARRRGWLEMLQEEFPPPPTEDDVLLAVLTYSDMTSSPDGAVVSPENRLQEILARYAAGDVVHDSIAEARPELLATCRRVELLLQAATSKRH